MIKLPAFLIFLFFLGCTQLTMPNLPIGQVSEAFKEREAVRGQLIDDEFHIPLVYNPTSAYPGWNLMAIPAEYQNIQVSVPYKIFHFGGVAYTGEVSPRGGSWIKVEQPGVLILRGLGKPFFSQSLRVGWNQIGVGFTPVKIKDMTINGLSLDNAEEYIIPIFYSWDSSSGEWGFINARKAESAKKELLPGVGYFVYARKENELVWG